MKYLARFVGCAKGAIGIHYWIETEVEGDTPGAAQLALYDRYDHIVRLTLTPIEKGPPPG